MSGDSSYIDYLQELLSGLGTVTARRMFGGYGIYHDGLMVAVVVDQRLYLKVDDETRPAFAAAGCEAWIYDGKGKPMQTSYWSVPDDAMDSREAMTPWARRAFAAALRKANAKPVPKSRRPTASATTAAKKRAPAPARRANTKPKPAMAAVANKTTAAAKKTTAVVKKTTASAPSDKTAGASKARRPRS